MKTLVRFIAVLAAVVTAATTARAQTWLINLNNASGYRGASQNGTDANGNLWNNLDPWYWSALQTVSGTSISGVGFRGNILGTTSGVDSYNGPLGTNVSNPLTQAQIDSVAIDSAALGALGGSNAAAAGYASATDMKFYLSVANTNLTYDVSFYGANKWAAGNSTYTAYSANYTTAIQSTSLNVGGGGSYNTNKTATLTGLTAVTTPDASQGINLQLSGAGGATGYLNALELYGYIGYLNGGTTTNADGPAAGYVPNGTYANGDSRSVDTVIGGNSTLNINTGNGIYFNSTLVMRPGGGAINAYGADTVYALTGSGNLTVGGNSTLTFSHSGNYSGTLNLNGSMTLAAAGGLGTGNLVLNGGNLNAGNASALGTGAITVASGTTTINNYNALPALTGNNPINFSGGWATLQVNGNGTILNLGSGNVTVTGNNNINAWNGGMRFDGVISGSGLLNWYGGGTLTLGGANTFNGTVAASGNSGTLSLANLNALQNATLNMGPSHTLGFGVSGNNTYNIGTLASSDSAATIALGGNTINAGGSNGSSTYNGTLTGTGGGLTKSGAGVLTLSGSNTYTGTTTVNAGTLSLNNANALSGGGNITFGGGTLQYSANNTVDYSSRFLNSSSAISIDTNGQNATFSSGISSTNTGGLIKKGSGTLVLGATNSFTGGVTLEAGTLGIGQANYLGASPSGLTFSGNSTLQFTGDNGAWNAVRPVTINSGVTATIDTQAYSDHIDSAIGGNGSLTKTGSGTLTLVGANAYAGGTSVTAGTLTLGGSSALGSTSGNLSVSAATLNMNSYSATVGALTGSNATFTGFNIGGGNSLAANSAALGGTTYIGINGASITGPGTSSLITSSGGGLTGTFQFAGAQNLAVPVNSLIVKTGNGTFYRATLNNTNTAEQIVVSSSPEKVLSIMSLGASIMAGYTPAASYTGGGFRSEMYQNLVNDGRFTPDFVGSNTYLYATSNGTNILTNAGEPNSEGHPSYTTSQILNNLNANDGSAGNNGGYWLAPGNGVNPNYIPLNAGGNDFGINPADTQAINRYDAIISQLNTLRSGVDTLATNLMYRTDLGASENMYFNPYVQGVVYNHVLAGQNVQFVDLYGLMTPGNSTAYISSDGIHPTQAGYNRMGDILYSSTVYGAAYWTGNQGGNWSTLSGTGTNWAMDSARTTDRQALLTDAAANTYSYADVYFNGNASPLSTTLGTDTTVRSLNFAAGATGAVIVGGNNTLTIGSGGITVQQGTGAHSVSSGVALASDQTWGNVSSNNLTVSGVVSGSGNLTIVGSATVYTGNSSSNITPTTISGTGGIVLSGANTYTGATTISSGTLQIGNGGSTGSLNSASAITNNGVLAFNRNNTITQGIDFAGTISGSGKVVQMGTGTLVFAGANTYSGETDINAGTLQVNVATTGSGTTGTYYVGNGGTTGTAATLNLGAAVTLANPIWFNPGNGTNRIVSATNAAGTTATYSGSITLNNSAAIVTSTNAGALLAFAGSNSINVNSNQFTVNGSGDTTISEVLGSANATGGFLFKDGPGTLILQNTNNTYTGTNSGSLNALGTQINAGTLGIYGDGSLGIAPSIACANIQFTGNGTLQDAANDITLNASRNISIAAGATATFDTNGHSLTIAGIVSSTGSGNVVKSGSGTLIFSGNNTYSGATTVADGTLAVNGSLASSSLTVGSSGTLSGTGMIAGDTTVAGTHNPGNSPGIQTFGSNLTYSGGASVVNWELSSNTNVNAANPNAIFDTVVVAGNLSFNGLTELSLNFRPAGGDVIWSDPFWQTSKTGAGGWLVYDVGGSIANFSNLSLVSANWQDSAGNYFDSILGHSAFSLYQSGGKIYLDYTVGTITTPEPSPFFAMAVVAILGSAAYLLRRRKNQTCKPVHFAGGRRDELTVNQISC